VIQETPQLEGEQYIDSESFEKQLSAKKKPNRFYYVPSGAIGEKVVESNENLATTPASKRDFQPQKIIHFSTNYQLLVKDDLSLFKQDILEYCGKPKLLKKARLFKDTNALWIESVDFVKNEPDKMLVIGEPVTKQQFFRLASYATSQKNLNSICLLWSFLMNKPVCCLVRGNIGVRQHLRPIISLVLLKACSKCLKKLNMYCYIRQISVLSLICHHKIMVLY